MLKGDGFAISKNANLFCPIFQSAGDGDTVKRVYCGHKECIRSGRFLAPRGFGIVFKAPTIKKLRVRQDAVSFYIPAWDIVTDFPFERKTDLTLISILRCPVANVRQLICIKFGEIQVFSG